MKEDSKSNGSSEFLVGVADPLLNAVPLTEISVTVAAAQPSAHNGPATETEDDKRRHNHKKRSKNWTRQETLRLIRLRSGFEPRFARSGRKSDLWDEISAALHAENICRDAQQCRDKWEKLTAGYKEARDGVKNRHDNPFFDELHPLLCRKDSSSNPRLPDGGAEPAVKVVPNPNPAAVTPNGVAVKEDDNNKSEEDDDDDGERTEEEEEEEVAPRPGKRNRCRYLTAAEADEILENLFVRQQRFFRELLDTIERKEQMREQIRQEKEDKWRAEERAERYTLNNAMILLTRKLLEQQQQLPTPPPPQQQRTPPLPPPPAAEGPVISNNPKKRSKNWKRAEVLRLIKFRGEMEGRFVRSSRRAALWDEVAGLLAREGIRRDGKQCREKWDKLVAEYKEVVDGKREPRDSPYFAELTAVVGQGRPPASYSSAADVSSLEQQHQPLDRTEQIDPDQQQTDIL